MAKVILDAAQLPDWNAFHAASKAAFGFPDYYGANMDAWIDCLSYLRDEEGMSRFRLAPKETLDITLSNSQIWREQQSEMLEELQFCIEAINDRYQDYGELPALTLALA